MTAISLKPNQYNESRVDLVVNGRRISDAGRIKSIRKVPGSSYRWEGETHWGDTFEVFGGKNGGGAANDWFLLFPEQLGPKPLYFNSAAAALRIINNM